MLRVVLIDDEPLVIEGLMEMIHWHEYGFKVTGVAHDGQSGLDLIKEIGPDLIITDIRMPELNGLKMIELCQKQMNKEMCFLVLSGYNDFDYIKTAMDLKSLSYILKPIDPDEIHKELQRIKAYFDQQQVQTKRLNENIALITTMTLNRIVNEPCKTNLIDRAIFLMNMDMTTSFSCGILQLSAKSPSNGNAQDKDLLIQQLITLTHMASLSIHFFQTLKDYQYFIIYGKQEIMSEFFSRQDIFEIIHNEGQGIRGILSKPVQDLHKINQILENVLLRVKLTFYDCATNEVFDFMSKQEYSKDLSLFDGLELAQNIEKLDKAGLDYYLSCLFRSVRQAKLDPHLLRMRWGSFLEIMGQKYQKSTADIPFSTFCEFKEICKSTSLFYYEMDRKTDTLPIIQMIKDYIVENYDSDLRLKSVAQKFGYNSVYLGQLFLKESNMKYNDYVLAMRMQKAKKLLLFSDKSIKEIALSIGFNNPDYFLQKFKEIEGTLPSRYRL